MDWKGLERPGYSIKRVSESSRILGGIFLIFVLFVPENRFLDAENDGHK